MGSNYVGEFVAQEEREAVEEKEWREREGTEIPPWMDEEQITAREYEGDYEDEEEELKLAEVQVESYRVKAW
jgi:uncharacterized protein YacL (UPF0231 family)